MIALAYKSAWGQLTGWDSLIEEYLLELRAAGRPATSIRLRCDQLHHLARTVGCLPGRVDVGVLLGWFAAHSWALETRRSYRSAVRSFFGWAYERGYLHTDPAAGLPTVAQRAGVPHPVPEDVYRAALAVAGSRVGLMLRLAAEAGLRRGEIARIHHDDLRADSGGFSLLVHGKGAKERLIPLADHLACPIAAAPGWLFGNHRGGHVSPEWVGEVCGAMLGAGYSVHGLRHRFATRAYAGSHDLRAVQELLGHSSPGVTQRYVAVGGAALRAAMMNAAG